MRPRALTWAAVPVLLALALPAAADPISGEWAASFEMEGRGPFTRVLKLELQATRVSGTAASGGREVGTVAGTWEKGELNLAIEGERGTMALTGALKDGRLHGDWDVGHASGKWSAQKKQP